MPKHKLSDAKEIILKVLEYCEAEKNKECLTIPLNQARCRVAAMTGVSKSTIFRIIMEKKALTDSAKPNKAKQCKTPQNDLKMSLHTEVDSTHKEGTLQDTDDEMSEEPEEPQIQPMIKEENQDLMDPLEEIYIKKESIKVESLEVG